MSEPIAYDPERHDPPPVFDVNLAALQEIDRVIGNQLALDEDDTTRVRGILLGALSGPRLSKTDPRCPGRVVAYADGRTGRCFKLAGHDGECT